MKTFRRLILVLVLSVGAGACSGSILGPEDAHIPDSGNHIPDSGNHIPDSGNYTPDSGN